MSNANSVTAADAAGTDDNDHDDNDIRYMVSSVHAFDPNVNLQTSPSHIKQCVRQQILHVIVLIDFGHFFAAASAAVVPP